MKVFLDLRRACPGAIGGPKRFAWYDTIRDEFETIAGEQSWDTWDEFKVDLISSNGDLVRYIGLCPTWAKYGEEES